MPVRKFKRLPSLRARVLLWVSVILVVLFAVTIVALDVTFQRSTERALEELLDAHLLGLIALAEPHPVYGLTLPPEALDPLFNLADSGLYGALWDGDGKRIWQSRSWLERESDFGPLPGAGERRVLRLEETGFEPARGVLLGITWEFTSGELSAYVLGIAVSLDPYLARQASFRRNLIGWFAGITAVMLAAIAVLLSRVLRPLGALERQVRDIEAGRRRELTGAYPSELTGLAQNLNTLIDTERRRQARYRNTLDDLAHSLKTPLAVMRTLLSESVSGAGQERELMQELERMDQRVSYQLRHARVSGATGLGTEPVHVAEVVADVRSSLDKVYRDKEVGCEARVADEVVFFGDRGDLMEIVGNLLDNAYKYCKRRVVIEVSIEAERLIIVVADDGPGIEPGRADELTRRGVRADETVPGHGIGLAVVRETVELYRGSFTLGSSAVLGGSEIRIELGRAGGAD
jgi:two-component system sensor histidine kinase PhoQ